MRSARVLDEQQANDVFGARVGHKLWENDVAAHDVLTDGHLSRTQTPTVNREYQ